VTGDSLWAVLWGAPGQLHEVRVGPARCWVPVEQRRAFVRLLGEDDVFVSPVPRAHPDDLSWAQTHVLWARLETPECAALLGRMRVGPTLVIREGQSSRRTALWALSAPLEGPWIIRATERLAHVLKGRRATASPTSVIPSPFTRITVGRARPSSCFIEYESETFATAREIVGGLRDAPERHDWRQAA
jgi:hypothetical protein